MQLLNHGISHELMDEVERLTKAHYATFREAKFQEFAARTLEAGEKGADVKDVDWESTFFVRHLPASNLADLPDVDDRYRCVQTSNTTLRACVRMRAIKLMTCGSVSYIISVYLLAATQ
jgi:hypothetical protein